MNWIDLRDRYGITQLILTKVVLKNGFDLAKHWVKFVIQVKGIVIEREAKTKING
jgi:aspartyl-tRNA synthetase